MRILAIGDIVGKNGTDFVRSRLTQFKREHEVDMVIANAENSAEGNGRRSGGRLRPAVRRKDC